MTLQIYKEKNAEVGSICDTYIRGNNGEEDIIIIMPEGSREG